MAKVSVEIGFTFRIGEMNTNQYAKVNLKLDEIDTSLPVETQLKEAKNAMDKIYNIVKEKLDEKIGDILSEKED